MFTPYDKALMPLATALLTWLNQKYGFKFDASPETVVALVGLVTAAVVYYVPNKTV